MLPANMVPFYFRESWMGTTLWAFLSGFCDKIINTIKGNTGSLSSFSEKLHLVIVNRWVMILDLSPSELSTPVWADSLPPSPPPVRCCWPLSTSLLLCPFTPGTVTEYLLRVERWAGCLDAWIHREKNMVLTLKGQTGKKESPAGERDGNGNVPNKWRSISMSWVQRARGHP